LILRAAVVLAIVLAAVPSAAQTGTTISIRPFIDITEDAFAATRAFDAVFGKTAAPFFGGGVQVTIADRFFVEVGASRKTLTGDRVFVVNNDVFHLGIPLRATLTPIAFTGGYRFVVLRHGDPIEWLRPYVGGGVERYNYDEKCAAAPAACTAIGGDFSAAHSGFVLNGGTEFRLHRWVGVSADIEYSRVTGIIGTGGASQAFSESDLGGVGGRFRVIVGR